MKVVVTGGAGFIGANLCRHLASDASIDGVLAFDDLSTGFRSNLDGVDATLVEGTILDPDALDAAMDGASAVVHLGARPSVPRSVADPVASHDANATGTMNVLEAARRAGDAHVIVASSSSVYGANPTLPKHEDLATRPMSPYARRSWPPSPMRSPGSTATTWRRSRSGSSTCSARCRPRGTRTRRWCRRSSPLRSPVSRCRSTATAPSRATSPTSTPSARSSPTRSAAGCRAPSRSTWRSDRAPRCWR